MYKRYKMYFFGIFGQIFSTFITLLLQKLHQHEQWNYFSFKLYVEWSKINELHV